MKYGQFNETGSQFVINTPETPYSWSNYLFNDQYYMDVSQTAQGNSMCLTPDIRAFTRKYKGFYIVNNKTKECWSPCGLQGKAKPEDYTCTHSLGWTKIDTGYKGIEASIRVFVPHEGIREIWTIKLKNNTEEEANLSLYSVFSFENGATMGTKCSFNKGTQILSSFSFPYHLFYEEKEKLENRNKYIYMFSDTCVNSFDCSEINFFGGDDTSRIPAAIENGHCSSLISEADNPIGAFEQQQILLPGKEKIINIVVGCANKSEEAEKIKEKLIFEGAIEEEFRKVEKHWGKKSGIFEVNTPDENLNYFMNYWLKKQISLMARNNRLSFYCPIRNQLQDAMGYSILDIHGAEELFFKLIKRQEANGYIQQWYMTDGSAPRGFCNLKHVDAPIWFISCISVYILETGNLDLLDKEFEFKDSSEKATVYEHLLRAAYYLAEQTGEHGLVLMGDGDWTDPINGAGRLGKGESTWATMGLKYAALQLLPFANKRGDEEAVKKLEDICTKLDHAVNTYCWDGQWYVAGYDDYGVPFGKASDKEAKIFLNSQTWAIMSGAARGDRLEKVIKSIEGLNTPGGPLLLAPALSGWHPVWGRLSLKLPGTTENGSIYCHGSMFKAYADCIAGDGDKAYETIRKTLPTNPDNPPEKNRQIPTFIPNYYFGLTDSPNFGHSSQHNSTGSAAWMIWVVLEHFLGVRPTSDGLTVKPCIPEKWPGYKVERNYKKARYIINVCRCESNISEICKITVDGKKISGDLLPYEDDKVYNVDVVL